ncbi:MAG: DHA2 family efflux MFS transporter permease subunit [Sphingomonadales bacterium]|nr:DHA2 family efflux MFS transporter permease subunit [Sphingomonadales bacterium]MDE2169777.1 DHA2 family efflux MFS transporter permease subunit [Sphingomonadales bacterium]
MNAEGARISPRVWAGYGLMCLGLFMAVLDVQIVATALPDIQRGLGIPAEAMSWIQTSYLTAEVIAIPLSGLLTRALSLRVMMVMALTGFTLASAACGLSGHFTSLMIWRIIQGFFGGLIIPGVFSAVFLLFTPRQEAVATTMAGVMAMLAPTLGPTVGGWITTYHGWHWLFFINLAPGLITGIGVAALLPPEEHRHALLRQLDVVGLMLLAGGLAALEIGLKQGPDHGWLSRRVLVLLCGAGGGLVGFVAWSLRRRRPLVDLAVLADRKVAVATYLNFTLGLGLYGATYVMVVFLGLVRGHDALAIGRVIMVTGAAQLLSAPIAVFLETRMAAGPVAAAGFALFGLGLLWGAGATPQSDFAALFWPQVIRGAALMVCILAATRLALGHLPQAEVANASGLFNLARNLGGAVGLALIDTVIYSQTPRHVAAIVAALRRGDVSVATQLGLPIDDFLAMHGQTPDAETRALLAPLVQHLAMSQTIDIAWMVMGGLTLLAPVMVLLMLSRLERTALKASTVRR